MSYDELLEADDLNPFEIAFLKGYEEDVAKTLA